VEDVADPDYASMLSLVNQYPNLIVLRTFSKAYGLAGLRLGYGIAHPALCDFINRIRQPFNVNALALIAGVAALQDQQHIQNTTRNNRKGLEFYYQAFRERGLEY